MEKVSILIPTRQRYKKLAKCLTKLIENTVYPNYEVVVITDMDDFESVLVTHEFEMSHTKEIEILQKEKREMYVGKINYGYHQTDSPLIIFLADDVLVNRNWLTEAVSTFNESFPDGMGLVSFQDEFDDRLAPHGLISRKYVEKYLKGNIFHPDYVHYWCDVELTVRSVGWGKFAHCPKSRVIHIRRARVEERDHICQEGLTTKDAGEKTFVQRLCYNFPDVMPEMKEWKLPKKVELRFRPTEMLEWYVGFGINTEVKDVWTVDRETALFLLGGWPLNFRPIGLEQSKAWDRYGEMLKKAVEEERKIMESAYFELVKHPKEADKCLFEFDDIAKKTGITYFLVYGICLGFVRNNGYIKGDNDIDLGITCSEEERDRFFEELEEGGFKRSYVITDREPQNHLPHVHFIKRGVLIDVWYSVAPEHKAFLELGRTVAYKGRAFNVPARVEEYLEFMYGNWRVPEKKKARI